MNKKIEALIKLREVISQQEELAGGEYIDCNQNHCAIGHLFKLGGVTNEQLITIEEGEYDLNGEGNYSIGHLLKVSTSHDIQGVIDDNFVKNSLTGLGFDLEKDRDLLRELQQANDKADGEKEKVIEKIDYFIDELQKETV